MVYSKLLTIASLAKIVDFANKNEIKGAVS